VVEEYWTELFVSWDVVWVQPSLWNGDGFYDSALWPAAGLRPNCDGPAPVGNAFYCAGAGFMAWDMQLFRENWYLGDAFVYMVVAHETAHAAQARFIADGEGPAVLPQEELQADCIAGATLAGAEQAGYLLLEQGDQEELVNVLISLGDAAPGEGHGTRGRTVVVVQSGVPGQHRVLPGAAITR